MVWIEFSRFRINRNRYYIQCRWRVVNRVECLFKSIIYSIRKNSGLDIGVSDWFLRKSPQFLGALKKGILRIHMRRCLVRCQRDLDHFSVSNSSANLVVSFSMVASISEMSQTYFGSLNWAKGRSSLIYDATVSSLWEMRCICESGSSQIQMSAILSYSVGYLQ